jgi:hypothetical protein
LATVIVFVLAALDGLDKITTLSFADRVVVTANSLTFLASFATIKYSYILVVFIMVSHVVQYRRYHQLLLLEYHTKQFEHQVNP